MNFALANKPSRLRVPRVFQPGSSVSELVLMLIIALALTVGAVAATQATAGRMLVGVFGGLCFFLIAMNGRETALRLTIFFLVYLGLIRRALIPFVGWAEFDPILLVGPGCAFMIWFNGKKEAPKTRDGLSVMVVFFFIWILAQVFNPLGGGPAAGALSLMFWLPPLFWFVVGRTFDIEEHKKVAKLVVILAVPVALHGLYQTYFGLLPFEYTWVGVSGFGPSIFYKNFQVRSFGPLTSPQEYGDYLSIAITFLWGMILSDRRRRFLKIALFLFLYWAMFLQGSRSIFILNMALLVVTSIMWTKNRGIKVLLPCLVAALGVFASTLPPPAEDGSTPASAAITHQLAGILNPGESSAETHAEAIKRGFNDAWVYPMGRGTSAATVVAKKVGDKAVGTDFDISNIFSTLGMPMGIMYLIFLALVYVTSFRQFKERKDGYTIAVIGLFIAIFGFIYSGGLYTVGSILWFTIGGMSRNSVLAFAPKENEEIEEPAKAPPVEKVLVPAT